MRAFDIEIPSPCDADWAHMRPEGRARFCSACKTRVHDLSAMTEREAERFVRRNAGQSAGQQVCLSFLRDAAGVIQFQPAAPRLVPMTRLLRRAAPAAGLALAMAACTPVNPEPRVAPAAAADVGPAPTVPAAHNPQPPEPLSLLDHPCDEPPVGPAQADAPTDGSKALDPPPPAQSEVRPLVRTAGKPVVRTKGRAAPSRP